MKYSIEIRPLATIETIEAYDWYETQRPGLGDTFLNALEEFYNTLTATPSIYSYYHNSIRQGLLKGFPYVVVYEVFGESVVVYSVFMTSLDPGKKVTQ